MKSRALLSTKKQRKRYRFVVDEDLGKSFYDVLQSCDKFDSDLFSDHWQPGTSDEVWISIVASKDLIVISHDGRMRKQHLPRIVAAGLGVIVIAGVTKPTEMAKHFVASWRVIERHLNRRVAGRFLSRFRAPFPQEIAKKQNPKGHIKWWDVVRH